MRLLDIILAMPKKESRYIASIKISDTREEGWAITINYRRFRPWTVEPSQIGPYEVRSSSEPLPKGIESFGFIRVPDTDHLLTVNGEMPVEDIESQIRLLQGSGLLGNIDAARFEHEKGILEWIIKTHAGSDKERRDWLESLKENERPLQGEPGH